MKLMFVISLFLNVLCNISDCHAEWRNHGGSPEDIKEYGRFVNPTHGAKVWRLDLETDTTNTKVLGRLAIHPELTLEFVEQLEKQRLPVEMHLKDNSIYFTFEEGQRNCAHTVLREMDAFEAIPRPIQIAMLAHVDELFRELAIYKEVKASTCKWSESSSDDRGAGGRSFGFFEECFTIDFFGNVRGLSYFRDGYNEADYWRIDWLSEEKKEDLDSKLRNLLRARLKSRM